MPPVCDPTGTEPCRVTLAFLPDWTQPVVWAVNAVVIGILLYGLWTRWRLWKQGAAGSTGASFGHRLRMLLVVSVFQRKVVRRRFAGLMHVLLYTGFIALGIGTTLVALNVDILAHLDIDVLRQAPYLAFEFALDLMGLAFLSGLGMVFFRRFRQRPKYLRNERPDLYLPGVLLLLILQGFVLEGLRLAVLQPQWQEWSFVGYALSLVFRAVGVDESFATVAAGGSVVTVTPTAALAWLYGGLWWFHAAPTSVCPAWTTGKALDPMRVILDLRKAMDLEARRKPLGAPLPDVVGYDELWACTTCMACMQECPVSIRHVPFIVDLRRNYALELGRIPEEAQGMLRNLETNYNPWGIGWDQRARWAEGLGVKTAAEAAAAGEAVEVLYWVGCAASFDDRNRKVAQSFARLLQKAGVKFAILGTEERCTGDPARRLGNEYLAQTMIKANVETLNRYAVKTIVTACPHCFNAIKHEYPDFGGTYEVVHHSVFLERLLAEGRLTPTKEVRELVTYHDACYLGRYNKVYDAPRDVLRRVPGMRRVEMEMCRDKGFCCGAGGARMWMEERVGEKVNHRRLEHVAATGAAVVASACPYCLIMLDDAAKAKDREDIARSDIAEILEKSL